MLFGKLKIARFLTHARTKKAVVVKLVDTLS